MIKVPKKPSSALLKKTGLEAAHAAGRVLRKHFGKKLDIRKKKDAGLVTQADVEAEKAAIKVIRKLTPEFNILTEEEGVLGGKFSPGRWIMDPLDGTTNFIHSFPMFCVSIAAEWDGEIVLGIIYHPIFGHVYLAEKGKGARLNGKKIHVSRSTKLEESLLATGFTYRRIPHLKEEMPAFERLSAVCRAIRRPGSAALDLAYTACGVFDGFWERDLAPWDVAAGSLLVQEAGGIVTDFSGNPFEVDGREIACSNPKLLPSFLRHVKP